MPLKLYPPGTRNNPTCYYAVGRILGKYVEVSTGETNARAARRRADAIAKVIRNDILQQRREAAEAPVAAPPAPTTFATVAADYMAAKGIAEGNERYYIDKLVAELGHLDVAAVTGADIAKAARALYPTHAATTLNRQAYTPAAAILHWAAEVGLRDYVRIRKLREDKPKARRPAPGAIERLVAETEGRQRLLLIMLWAQGWRISEALRITWEDHVRLADMEFDLQVTKARTWKVVQMHPDVFEALAAVPAPERKGRLFPWRDRFAVYRWLKPLCKSLGVTFTPHQARHAFASDLNAAGATDADLVNAGSWTSPKAIARYTEVDRHHARATLAKRGSLKKAEG